MCGHGSTVLRATERFDGYSAGKVRTSEKLRKDC